MEIPNPTPDNPTTLQSLEQAELGTILRSKNLGTYKINGSKAWGRYLAKVPDPDGLTIPKKVINGFLLKENFPKIPAVQWSTYISLCFYMSPPGSKKLAMYEHDSQLEVTVCLLRDQATLTQWKIVVPKQIVDGTRVEADLRKSVDIVTGEEYDIFPPLGWLHAGSTHSHNTMKAFYSSTDDTSELTVPGLHIVVGEIDHQSMEYSHVASIVLQKQRKNIDLLDVVEVEPVPNCPFHSKVLDYIKVVVDTNLSSQYSFPGYSDSSKSPFSSFRNPYFSRPSRRISRTMGDAPKLEDEVGKLNSFYRNLDRNNSDLFDDLAEDVDIFTLTDSELKSLVKEEALNEDLNVLAHEDAGFRGSNEELDELILRDLAEMEGEL